MYGGDLLALAAFKELATVSAARISERFREEYRLPLGGHPNFS